MTINYHQMETRPLAVIAAIQVGAIVAGTLITSFIMKTAGYGTSLSSPMMEYNIRSVWIRENGFMLIGIPILWIAYALWNESRNEHKNRFSISIGILILLMLIFLYIDSIGNPYIRKIPTTL